METRRPAGPGGRSKDMPLTMLGARSGTNRLLLSRMSGSLPCYKWRFEVQHLSTLMGMVEEGVGLGIVPELTMRSRTGGDLIQRRLINPDFRRTIVLVERERTELSPAAEKLKTVILDAYTEVSRTK